jgi:hypothetical protein
VPASVARALAASLEAPRATDRPPSWLDPQQADAFRLLLPVLRQYGAALCAEPVGTGKTYIALAIALVAGRTPTVALVPAALVGQWRGTAGRLGVPLTAWSHSRLSRGHPPPGDPPLVIIDESHHFRNPTIRRYATVAPWLLGRRVLLLSATPLVNHSRDLYHQLHLGIRDDALAADGVPSIRAAFEGGTAPAVIGRFVVQRLDGNARPKSASRTVVADSGAIALIPELESLRLSADPGIAALVRSVLQRAASSSAMALEGALRRYRRLLHHARDARDAGRRLDRTSLRRFTLGTDDQLLLWALLPSGESAGELQLEDLPALEAAIEHVHGLADRPDAKSRLLQGELSDGRLTLVFTGARETVTFLRRQLEGRTVAWCTGGRSGIGRVTMPREIVLEWFRPGPRQGAAVAVGRPVVLLATDVAAEGLDLQAAGRIVHYDLPWTDVRLAQRNGRAVRRGATHESVEVIQIAPGQEFEVRLHQMERLLIKAQLPARHGLGPAGTARWRWREPLSGGLPGAPLEGIAGVASGFEGVLAGIALEGEACRMASRVLWRDGGGWTAEPGIVAARIGSSHPCHPRSGRCSRRLRPIASPAARQAVHASISEGASVNSPAPLPCDAMLHDSRCWSPRWRSAPAATLPARSG